MLDFYHHFHQHIPVPVSSHFLARSHDPHCCSFLMSKSIIINYHWLSLIDHWPHLLDYCWTLIPQSFGYSLLSHHHSFCCYLHLLSTLTATTSYRCRVSSSFWNIKESPIWVTTQMVIAVNLQSPIFYHLCLGQSSATCFCYNLCAWLPSLSLSLSLSVCTTSNKTWLIHWS